MWEFSITTSTPASLASLTIAASLSFPNGSESYSKVRRVTPHSCNKNNTPSCQTEEPFLTNTVTNEDFRIPEQFKVLEALRVCCEEQQSEFEISKEATILSALANIRSAMQICNVRFKTHQRRFTSCLLLFLDFRSVPEPYQ